MTDELTPSVISRDRLTNELITLRAEHTRVSPLRSHPK
ncbi:DUF3945 domain-containing protein [Chryseobacterium sp. NKUCC03_KSP]|nr:DUF3945 domain-containing protein [Chryseobacterium sp. NKUCC03_KSP]